ncbi:MAG: hypothetical protein AAGD11_06480 [Planctomycetota bacterium]
MDREELTSLIKKGPVRILMNDGNSYKVPSAEFALVSDIAAYKLYRADDGKMRTMVLPLVTMSGVEPLAADI